MDSLFELLFISLFLEGERRIPLWEFRGSASRKNFFPDSSGEHEVFKLRRERFQYHPQAF